jgi:hypothetical protein
MRTLVRSTVIMVLALAHERVFAMVWQGPSRRRR